MGLSVHQFVLSTLRVCVPPGCARQPVRVRVRVQICVRCSGDGDTARWRRGFGIGSGLSPSRSRVSRSKEAHLLKVAQEGFLVIHLVRTHGPCAVKYSVQRLLVEHLHLWAGWGAHPEHPTTTPVSLQVAQAHRLHAQPPAAPPPASVPLHLPSHPRGPLLTPDLCSLLASVGRPGPPPLPPLLSVYLSPDPGPSTQ